MDASTSSAGSDSAPVQISAAMRVLALPELLHEILLYVSQEAAESKDRTTFSTDPRVWKITVPRPAMCDLFVLQGVSHLWKNTINTSTPLKKAMWLVPKSKDQRGINPVAIWCIFAEPFGNEIRDMFTMQTIAERSGALYRARVAKLSPLQADSINGDKRIRLGTSNEEQSWRNMHVMNEVDLEIELYGRSRRGEAWLDSREYKSPGQCTLGQIYDWARHTDERSCSLWFSD